MKALVEKTCGTACHSLDVVTPRRMDARHWREIVHSMVARGAEVSEAEAAAIAEYLAKRYE